MEVVEGNDCQDHSTNTENVSKPSSPIPNCEEVKECEGEIACSSDPLTEEVSDNKESSSPPHHSSFKWTNFTKALKLGPSVEAAVPQLNALPTGQYQDKRGSLGKLFRHRLSLNTRSSSSYNVDCKGELGDIPGKQESELGHHKKPSLWKVLKHGGKTSNCISEANIMSGNGSHDDDDDKVTHTHKKLSLGKLLKSRKYTDSLALEKSKVEAYSTCDDTLPPANVRTRSLGKYFRYRKDSNSFAEHFKKSHKNKDRPVSARNFGEKPIDEARGGFQSDTD